MTRIGNDTKTTQAKSTTTDGPKEALATEDAPSLDEIAKDDGGEPSFAAGFQVAGRESQTMLCPPAPIAFPFVDVDVPEALALEQTPLFRELHGLEQQCAMELQGHAYELTSLAGEATPEDGVCLERAGEALASSSSSAASAAPGAGLPLLAAGLSLAREHVSEVRQQDVKEKGEAVVAKSGGVLDRASAAVLGLISRWPPEPAPGEAHEIGGAGALGVGVVEGGSKDVLGIARELGSDGRGGDYVVTREVTFEGGLKSAKPGAGVEVGDAKLEAGVEVGSSIKAQGSVRFEYRSATLPEAHARAAELLKDKALAMGTSLIPTVGPMAAPIVEAALNDGEEASAVVYTGTVAGEAAAQYGALKGELAIKGSRSLRNELDKGKVKGGELSVTRQVEGGVTVDLGTLGPKGSTSDVTGDEKLLVASAALTASSRFVVDEQGNDTVKGRSVSATLEVATRAGGRSVKIELPPGEDADAVLALMARGEGQAALGRLLDGNGTVTLEAVTSRESALGLDVDGGAVSAKGRFHYKQTARHPIARQEGAVRDALGQVMSGSSSSEANAELSREVSRNRPVG